MKDFDRVELGAVRKMAEADYFFEQHKGVAARQEIHSHYKEKWAAWWNRIVMKEERL